MHKDEDTSSGRGGVSTKSIIIALVAVEKPNNLPFHFKVMLGNFRDEMKLGEWGDVCDVHKSSGFTIAGNSTVGCKTHRTKWMGSHHHVLVRQPKQKSSSEHHSHKDWSFVPVPYVCTGWWRKWTSCYCCGLKKESKNDKVVVKEKDRQTRTPSPSGRAFMQYKSKTNV